MDLVPFRDPSAANLIAATTLPHARGRQRAELLLALLARHFVPQIGDALAALLGRLGRSVSDPEALREILPVVADTLGGVGAVGPDYRAAVNDLLAGPPPNGDPFQWAGDLFGRMMRAAFPGYAPRGAVPMPAGPRGDGCEGCGVAFDGHGAREPGWFSADPVAFPPLPRSFRPFQRIAAGHVDEVAGVVGFDVLLGDGFVPGSLRVAQAGDALHLRAFFCVDGRERELRQTMPTPATRYALTAKEGAPLAVKVSTRGRERIATITQAVDFGAAVPVEGDEVAPAEAMSGDREGDEAQAIADEVLRRVRGAGSLDEMIAAVHAGRAKADAVLSSKTLASAFASACERGQSPDEMTREHIERLLAETLAEYLTERIMDGGNGAATAAEIVANFSAKLRAAATVEAWLAPLADTIGRLHGTPPASGSAFRRVVERDLLDAAVVVARRGGMGAKEALDFVGTFGAEMRAAATVEAWLAAQARHIGNMESHADSAPKAPEAPIDDAAKLGAEMRAAAHAPGVVDLVPSAVGLAAEAFKVLDAWRANLHRAAAALETAMNNCAEGASSAQCDAVICFANAVRFDGPANVEAEAKDIERTLARITPGRVEVDRCVANLRRAIASWRAEMPSVYGSESSDNGK